MIKPRKMIKQEKEYNDRVWELRIKYKDFDPFTDGIDDFIVEQPIEQFKKRTKQFNTPAEYLKALAVMSKCINNAQEVPAELWTKVRQTRKDFEYMYKYAE